MTDTRKVAVVGGNRIPFARQDKTYRHASNPDMLTATLDGLVDRHRPGWSGARRGGRRRGPQARPRLEHGPRGAFSAPSSRPRPRRTTSSRRVAPGWRPRSWSPTRSRSARSTPASRVVSTPRPTRRSRSTTSLRRVLIDLNSAKTLQDRLKALARVRPGQDVVPEIPRNAEPRTGLSMGDHAAITALEWGIGREAQDELAYRSHATWPPPTTAASSTTSSRRTWV